MSGPGVEPIVMSKSRLVVLVGAIATLGVALYSRRSGPVEA